MKICYFVPFKILHKIGNAAYKLQLPLEARLHPVFHVSLLKKCISDSQEVTSMIPMPLLTNEYDPLLQPKRILQFRSVLRNGQQIQLLVKWDGLPFDDNTCEDIHHLHESFPQLNLEDKVTL